VSADLDAGTYTDPRSGDILFEDYAEGWRTARTHGETTGINVEHQFRLHVYAARRIPSLCQQWIAGMKLADSTKVKVIDRVSEVFSARSTTA
jgi:hypothetical protein